MKSTAIIKKSIIGFLFLASMQASIASGSLPVLGLSLCGNTTEIQIKNVAQANGGVASDMEYNDYFRQSTMRVTGYQIAGGPRDIEFFLFRGKLFGVLIKNAEDLEEVLQARYGKPIKQESIYEFGSLLLKKYFNSRIPDVEITHTSTGKSSLIYYDCKRVDKQRINEAERIEKSNSLKRPGAEKL